jgi:hypothetical protein
MNAGACREGDFKFPSGKNICNTTINTPNPIENFCSIRLNKSLRNSYCSNMSSAGEWVVDESSSSACHFRPGAQPASMNDGHWCCGGQCRILGSTLSCKRVSFKGDPLTCCLKDYDNDKKTEKCFSDDEQQKTCDPKYRSSSGSGCRDVLKYYCSGTLETDDPNSTEWLKRWFTVETDGTSKNPYKPCETLIYENVFDKYTTDTIAINELLKFDGICNKDFPNKPPFTIKSEGYYWAQETIRLALKHYNEQFQIGALPGSVKSNPWEIFLYQKICCPLAGVCQDGLNEICSTTSVKDLKINSLLAQWCGCHLPNEQYEEYSIKFNIPKQCASTCNRIGTIPIVGINNNAVNCTQNICLIDDVNVSIVNTQVGGGINFEQFCGNCGGGQCTCIISDTTVDISNSTIGGNVIPGLQNCGSFTCSQTNSGSLGPNNINVPCNIIGYNPYDDYDKAVNQERNQARKKSWILTIMILLISLIIIYLIIIFVHPKN